MVSIRIQFGLGLDLKWVTITMLTCFTCMSHGELLVSVWIQIGFNLALALFWFWIGSMHAPSLLGFSVDSPIPQFQSLAFLMSDNSLYVCKTFKCISLEWPKGG